MIASRTEYSSELCGYLDVAGQRHVLGQLGPQYLILRDAASAPAGRAEIVMFHDGEESRFNVELPEGVSPTIRQVPYRKLTLES